MDAEQPTNTAGAAVRIQEVFPPLRLAPDAADALSAFTKPAEELRGEPRPLDAFLLVAVAGTRPIGYAKLQCALRACWIRELAVDPAYRRRGVGRRLVRYAADLVAPARVLAIEVAERDDVAHRFLRACGLVCQAPWLRSRRQLQRGVYEFRTWTPPPVSFAGAPRFAWP